MKMLTNLPIALIIPLLLTGCLVVDGRGIDGLSDDSRAMADKNRQLISTLALGVDRDSVLGQLGAPQRSEASIKQGDEYRVLYYKTQHHSFHRDHEEALTPLVFKNGQLIGWGQELLATTAD